MSSTQKNKGEEPKGVLESLTDLQKEFEAFRASTPVACKRRFPAELKAKVLNALNEKIPMEAIISACRITPTQIDHWRCIGEHFSRGREVGQGVRAQVLDVVPHQPEKPVSEATEAVEIRLGRWLLQLRLDQASLRRE